MNNQVAGNGTAGVLANQPRVLSLFGDSPGDPSQNSENDQGDNSAGAVVCDSPCHHQCDNCYTQCDCLSCHK